MNKLANTYLDAVDSLLAIHLKRYQDPVLDDWTMIVANLADAVRELNQSGLSESSPHCFHHNSATDELEQQKNPIKSLTLYDLYLQVESALSAQESDTQKFRVLGPDCDLWIIGDFEIRRRK